MRSAPNQVIKIHKKNGAYYYAMFLTGKFLSFYLLVFAWSAREKKAENLFELHANGQTSEVRFFCDKNELLALLEEKNHDKN